MYDKKTQLSDPQLLGKDSSEQAWKVFRFSPVSFED